MMPRNQLMNSQTANAILLQQHHVQQRQRIHHTGNHHHRVAHQGAAQIPTIIPHNSANVETQLLCNYSQYLCRREKISGYEYCSRHILEDKNAPYKPCNFQYTRIHPNRRCPKSALKTDKKDG